MWGRGRVGGLLVAVLVAGCTGPSTTPTTSTPNAVRTSGPPATHRPSATATTNPYTLKVPAQRDDELARTVRTRAGSTGFTSGTVKAGRHYRLRGACIFGIDDASSVIARKLNADATNPGILVSVPIPCDGGVHSRTVSFYQPVMVSLAFEPTGPKTVGWATLRPR